MLEDVYRTIDANREKYIGWLQTLCRQESVAAQGRGMEAIAKLVEDLLTGCGARAERLETSGYPVVYGELEGTSPKTLSFYNHYDVQPEDPLAFWESDPWDAEIRDDTLYARGVADNKGNLMARVAAVHAFLETRGELPLGVKFIVEGEEEIGSPHLAEFTERYPDKAKADGCIWEFGYQDPDGRLQVSLGVKGMCYVELRARGANTDLHSANAAIVENPAWRLVWALASLKNDREEVMIDGFYDRVQAPDRAERALLESMAFDEATTLTSLGLDGFVLGLSGSALKETLIYGPTCTICGLESGYTGEGSKTVLPNAAKVKLDFRLVPDQDPAEILRLLRRHLDARGFGDIEIVDLSGEHPAKTDLAHPLVRTVIACATEVYGRPPTVNRISPGTGPMFVLCQAQGVPAVSVGVGHHGSKNHAPNENIRLSDFIQGVKMIAAVMDAFARSEGAAA